MTLLLLRSRKAGFLSDNVEAQFFFSSLVFDYLISLFKRHEFWRWFGGLAQHQGGGYSSSASPPTGPYPKSDHLSPQLKQTNKQNCWNFSHMFLDDKGWNQFPVPIMNNRFVISPKSYSLNCDPHKEVNSLTMETISTTKLSCKWHFKKHLSNLLWVILNFFSDSTEVFTTPYIPF